MMQTTRVVIRIALASMVVLAVAGAVTAARIATVAHDDETRPMLATPEDLRTPAGVAVLALTRGDAGGVERALGGRAEAIVGYRPVLLRGVPADPDGGCSSPVPLPHDFDDLCRTHDLGYDLLRAAERTGHPLGRWARVDLDRALVTAMRRSCTNPFCGYTVDAVSTTLRVNTHRQPGAPRREHLDEILASLVAVTWR